MKSSLPDGLDRQVNRFLRDLRGESLEEELVTCRGQGISLTKNRLLLSNDESKHYEPSAVILLDSITDATWELQKQERLQLVLHIKNGYKHFIRVDFVNWPRARQLLSKALEQNEVNFDVNGINKAIAELQQSRARIQLAAAKDHETKQLHLKAFTTSGELDTLYGRLARAQQVRNQRHDLQDGLVYQAGIPVFDEYFADLALRQKTHVGLLEGSLCAYDRGDGLALEIKHSSRLVHFRHSQVERISIDHNVQAAQVRPNSPIGGALLGGLLFGSAGAIVGAMASTGQRDIVGSNLLTMHVKLLDNEVRPLVFSVPDQQLSLVRQYLQNIYRDSGVLSEQTREAIGGALEATPTNFMADLDRLIEHYKAGLLTEAEFQAAKVKLGLQAP